MITVGFMLAVMAHALASAGGGPEQSPDPQLVTVKGTIVSPEPSQGGWLLELDRGIDTAAGRVRSVHLVIDERRRPAHAIGAGDRIKVAGRLLSPVQPGFLSRLEPVSVEHLADPGLTHAYFLFRSGRSDGCAECYVPLLLTTSPIAATSVPDFELIITFERDSIWTIPDRPAKLTDVQTGARTLRLDDRPYRYQEVSPEEAIRLLKNPLGSLPISRPGLPDAPTLEHRRALLFRLGVREP